MPSHRVLLELTRRYNEPHRHYHNIEHIAFMLHLGRDLHLTDEQTLAIWFHDAVYDVHSKTNEEDSAALAVELLTADGYPPEKIDLVERMVLDTKAHRPTIEPSQLVVDLDLAPLGLPWDQFAANTEKIHREFCELPVAQVDADRRRFFEAMLATDRIFSSSWGSTLEAQARQNLARSIAATS